ncbi:MAG: TldD/PmbA family protein [Gemmatimonadales bacterium]|nr:TldD/PmbA family protein [Gemmatimonadales bacterium]
MKRRDFVQWTGLGAGIAMVPNLGHSGLEWSGSLTPVPAEDRKKLADVGLTAAKAAGASYADIRIGRYLNQFINARDTKIQGITNTESFGVGIRVIANGTWGFASTNDVTTAGVARAAAQAVAIAKANATIQKEPVRLAPVPSYGEVSWKTPIEKNAFEVSVTEKADLLKAAAEIALKGGASFVDSGLFLVNEQKYYASSEGSYIDQDIHRIWPQFNVTSVDKASGKFETRASYSAPMGMGWEYMSARPAGRVVGLAATTYGNFYDMVADAAAATEDAKAKHTAKSVDAGKWDLVLDPSHLWLTIHESVGHPLELDRVLGYEANYAGTSFATLDKWKSGTFKYGSELVNFTADRTQPNSLGAVGYDDEGVKARRWDLVKKGILVNYQAIRDQVQILDQKESHGACYADSWSDVQFQRMPNVSLEPGDTPMTPAQMIAGVEKGIYIVGDSSYSIDQQRYNFQFSGQVFYEIKAGKIVGMLRDVAYQSNTQEFWNAVVGVCDRRDYRMGGSFFDGKGQPPQISAVSHGSSTTRVNGVNILNTARKL